MRILILISSCLLLCCCKTNRIVNTERQGLWIEKNKIDSVNYKSKGRYNNGFQHKIWRYFENGTLVKKEKYKDSVCTVTHYRDRKKIREGQTKLRVNDTVLHWFYFGDWKTFDASGKITEIDHYVNGELISTDEFRLQE